jgi:hypothetical protein
VLPAASTTPPEDFDSTVTLNAAPEVVLDALTTRVGLASWWAPVIGDGLAGGELALRSGPDAVLRALEPSGTTCRGRHAHESAELHSLSEWIAKLEGRVDESPAAHHVLVDVDCPHAADDRRQPIPSRRVRPSQPRRDSTPAAAT